MQGPATMNDRWRKTRRVPGMSYFLAQSRAPLTELHAHGEETEDN